MLYVSGTGLPLVELAGALRSWRTDLIADWQASAARRMEAGELYRDGLDAHVPGLLDRVESALLDAPGAFAGGAGHDRGLERVVEELPGPARVRELAELRSILVQRWWGERALLGGLSELLAIDRAFDSLVGGLAQLERRRLEGERRRFETILQTLPAGVITADADGGIVDANQAAYAVWGGAAPTARNIEEYVQYRGWWVTDGQRIKPADWPLARAVRDGETTAGVLIDIERFDGTCGTMMNTAAPLRDASGRIAGAVAVMLDMTQQRRLAVQLEQQTAEMNTVLESIAEGLVVFGPRREIVRVNAAAAPLLPYSPEELDRAVSSGQPLDRITWPDGTPISPERLPHCRALNGETVRGEMMRLGLPDGSIRWVSASAAPIRGPSGGLQGAVVMLVDVTHLQEMRRQMEDLLRMLSHDLRTPLGTVLLQSQMLERNPGACDDISRRAHAIATSAGRMNAMIQDLVELARLESGRIHLELKQLDPRAFMLELQERLAGTIPMQRVRMAVPESLPPLRADPCRLERIVVNLLSNALKYSPPDREVLVQAEDRDGSVALSVTDFGLGIPADELPRLFERYYRSRRAVRGGIEGLGLGLYITRQLVEAHGATITVDSELDRGTTFTVVFAKPAGS